MSLAYLLGLIGRRLTNGGSVLSLSTDGRGGTRGCRRSTYRRGGAHHHTNLTHYTDGRRSPRVGLALLGPALVVRRLAFRFLLLCRNVRRGALLALAALGAGNLLVGALAVVVDGFLLGAAARRLGGSLRGTGFAATRGLLLARAAGARGGAALRRAALRFLFGAGVRVVGFVGHRLVGGDRLNVPALFLDVNKLSLSEKN